MKLAPICLDVSIAVIVVAALSCTSTGNQPVQQDHVNSKENPLIDNPENQPQNSSVATFAAVDVPSNGGTLTFQNIGATGWYPSSRDPSLGMCDAYVNGSCCMAKRTISSDSLTPWSEELIMTLRGPMIVKQFAVYQPDSASKSFWNLVSCWDDQNALVHRGTAFSDATFSGVLGNKCLVDLSTDRKFPSGPGSVPYCKTSSQTKYYGWKGPKLFIVLATMPHVISNIITPSKNCSTDPADNWYNAPWIGLSVGELVRSGKFDGCNCNGKDPAAWWNADGCGQFNIFEVVNDNNTFQNFDLFSTNFFSYAGNVGEGPCGKSCKVSNLDPIVDLIDKSTSLEAVTGGVASPQKGQRVAFRRPNNGYRYFIILLDVDTRTVQLAMIHPNKIPPSLQFLIPNFPSQTSRTQINTLLNLRLPATASTGIRF